MICLIIQVVKKVSPDDIIRFADMLAAIGTEPRLRITQLLLTAHPDGMVANEIQGELGVSAPALSHHLDKLKHEGVVTVKREGTFLRYTVDTDGLQDLLTFLFSECCARTNAVKPDKILTLCKCAKD
jgi:DNA-binding transcriptional ArsR family regulator